jgi:hypothetical protein
MHCSQRAALQHRREWRAAHRSIALQPRDFFHDWTIRPWDEMQSRSAVALEEWHRFRHADYVFGGYEFAQPYQKGCPRETQAINDNPATPFPKK